MASAYTSVEVAGFNANPPPDDGTASAANQVRWSKHVEKIGTPLKTAIEGINANLVAAFQKLPDLDITTAEQAAGVTPTSYSYEPGPVIDIRRYGYSESASAAVNTAAIAAASAVANAISTQGAVIQLPPGTFDHGSNLVDIPPHITIRGAGQRATRINSSNTGTYAFRLGGASTGVLKNGCGLTDLRVQMSHVDGKAIQLLETCQGFVKRIYIEGPINATRSTKGVVIDGGNASAFYNIIEQVEANHIHIGFEQLTSGTTQPTQNIFLQCAAFGDVLTDASSVGYRLAGGHGGEGSGSIWIGGNLEYCFRGMYFTSGCGASSHSGARFEGCTKDVEAEATPGAQSFLGCWLDDVNGISDGSGGTRLKFIGCTNGSNLFGITRDPGTHRMQAVVTGEIPLRLIAFPGDTTTDEITVEDSSNTVMFSVTAQGKVRRINGAAPATVTGSRGGNAALADLLTKLAATGIIVDGSSA